MQQLLSKY